jgi:pimeloyl-ACP methyl ester carboxylesterase
LAISPVTLQGRVTLSAAATGDPSGPVVLLLPGPTDSWRSYQPVLERLPPSLRAIAVSQRGHGDSGKPPTDYRVEDFAADVPAFLDALGIERAVLAGHSGSCLAARRVAIDSPERVAGLVLEASPTTLRGHAGLTEFIESVVFRLQDPIDPGFARTFVAETSSGRLAPELLEELATELVKVPARVWKEMFTALASYDDLVEIEHISAPALLVWGDADVLVDREMQTTLVARLPDAELVVYRGVGHTPRWEHPARFACDVAALVDRSLQPRR